MSELFLSQILTLPNSIADKERRRCKITKLHERTCSRLKRKLSTKLICLSWIMEVNERLYTEWSGPIIEKRRGQRSTNPSFALSSLFLANWSRFSAVKSHENPTPMRNYFVSEPVIYPFIEFPTPVGRRTLTSDDFLSADKCEEINANTLLQ